jgi:eukaryotic-like serine/threonine-protein kinase
MRLGQEFGPFVLLYGLAHGGISMIHRAKFIEHDDLPDVVVKRLKTPYNGDSDFVQMLADEAELMNQLQHPNIVKVHEFGQVRDQYFLATEFVDGVNLRQLLRRATRQDQTVRIETALYILTQALNGLHYAHSVDGSLVHRDFTPSNVMVSFDGAVKLIDFGIAKSKLARTKTRGGVIKGKLKYMSPEQTKGVEISPKSDLFSAGIVAYELMTGVLPFDDVDEAGIIRRIRDEPHKPPSLLNAGLDHAFDGIMDGALAKSPQNRLESVRAFAQHLLEWASTNQIAVVQSTLAGFASELFAQERRERRMDLETMSITASSQSVSEYTRIVGTGYGVSTALLSGNEETS